MRPRRPQIASGGLRRSADVGQPRRMPLPPDLVSLAGRQRGVFTTSQAAGFAVSPPALVRLVRTGRLLHPSRGLYLMADQAAEAPDERHRQLCAGALLLYPDAALDGLSAVLAHDLPVWSVDLGRPEIARPIHRSAGAVGFRVRPSFGATSVETPLGPAIPAPTAVVRMSLDHGVIQGVVSADAALHRGLATPDSLAEVVARVATWPHASRARTMLSLVDGRSESVGESILRVEAALRGIRLVPQFEVHDRWGRLVGRADFVVEGTRVLVEFDGKVKYAAGDPEVLWAEKRREDGLREAGYLVVRVTWADLARPDRIMTRIRRAMLAASA